MKIVAELGINHGGSRLVAEKMIWAAKKAGCDAVKIQNYRTDDFLHPDHPDYWTFYDCEIWPHLERLAHVAHNLGLEIGSTPSSKQGVVEAYLAHVDYLKVSSDALLHHELIQECGSTGIPVVVSSGMADFAELAEASAYIDSDLLTVLICTSLYPCPAESVNLARWKLLPLLTSRWGLSDHTIGTTAAVSAVALGASMIEKHFTLDHSANGLDHGWSADPEEMRALVDAVHDVPELLGNGIWEPQPEELEGREKYRFTVSRKRLG